MPESNTAHTVASITVPPLSANTMLESATQPSSVMSCYSVVDHNTPPGFVTGAMGTCNDLSQLALPAGSQSFAPDLVYGLTSDDSPFYSSDSCYSPNPHYPRQRRMASRRCAAKRGRLHTTPPSALLEPYPQQQSPLHPTSRLPAWYGSAISPNEGSKSSEGTKLRSRTASNNLGMCNQTTTLPSAEPKRKHSPSFSEEAFVNSTHSSHRSDFNLPEGQFLQSLSQQDFSTDRNPPRKPRRTSSLVTATPRSFLGEAPELSLCFDSPSPRGLKESAANQETEATGQVGTNKKAEINETEKADANESMEGAQRVNPYQVVNNLVLKWTTLADMPFGPSYRK